MIVEAIKTGVRAGLINTFVCTPAIIESFNTTTQTIKANIAIKRIVDGIDTPYTVLIDIPILLPTVQGFHLTMPIKAGDECLLIFADRCIDEWFEKGGVQKQSEHRIHDISDGFAIIGVNSKPNIVPNYSADDMVIRNTANNQKVTLKSNGDIDVETIKNINVKCTNAVIEASSSINATAPNTTINSTTVINGDTTVNGLFTLNGAMATNAGSSGSGAEITGVMNVTDDVTASGVSLKGHTHGGVDAGGDNTSPPN